MSRNSRKSKHSNGSDSLKSITDSYAYEALSAIDFISSSDWFKGNIDITEDTIHLYAYLLELDLLSRWVELAKLQNPILAKVTPVLRQILEEEQELSISEHNQQKMSELFLEAINDTPEGDVTAVEAMDQEFYEKVKALYFDLKDISSVFAPLAKDVPALETLMQLTNLYGFFCQAILKGFEPMEAYKAFLTGANNVLDENGFLYPFETPEPIKTFISPRDRKNLERMDFPVLDTAYFELAMALTESSKKELELIFRKYSDELADNIDYKLIDRFNQPKRQSSIRLENYPMDLPDGPLPPEIIKDMFYYYGRALRKYSESYCTEDLSKRYRKVGSISDAFNNEATKEMVATMALLNNQNPLYAFAESNKTHSFSLSKLDQYIQSRYSDSYTVVTPTNSEGEEMVDRNYILGPIPEF